MSRRSLGFRLGASLLVTVCVLIALEGAARTVGPVVPGWQAPPAPGVAMIGHRTRLWSMAPGVQQNGATTATVNADGLRGPPPELPRPTGRERVLVLGDSSFFGHGIPDDQTLSVHLAAALAERGVDADTVNGGTPGYSTEQTRILLEEVGWSYQPTLLLVGSLWSDNNADGFRDADLLRTTRLFYDNPLAASALYRLGVGWADRLRGGGGPRVITWTRDSAWPTDGQRRVPLVDYGANLDAIVRDARARGIGVAFVAPTNVALVTGRLGRGASWDPYFDAQAAIAAWHGVPVVSALEAIRAEGLDGDTGFVDKMHPSGAGARAIARRAAADLVAAGWPATRLLGRAEPFDAAALVDDAPVRSGVQDPSASPQGRLFPGVVEDGAGPPPGTAPDRPAAPMTPPDAPAPPDAVPPSPGDPAPSALAPTPPAPTAQGSWLVRGTVSGASGAVQVTVRAQGGRPLAFTNMPGGGEFSMAVDRTAGPVEVTATDATGAKVSARAEVDAAPVPLVFPR